MGDYILIADDDANIGKLISLYLTKEGFTVKTCLRGDDALDICLKDPPKLLILDVMMPGMDGWNVLRTLRQDQSFPVLMLTARGETFDKVMGLEMGADDYVVKPFEPRELVARVKALLRRVPQQEDNRRTLRAGKLSVSLAEYEVRVSGKAVPMPPRELELLYFLMNHPGQAFTREQLLEHVWGYDFFGDSRTVDVHVKRLRERLGAEIGGMIKTVWGVGYKFEASA
nr:response regulator transcription factor [bacterium]